MNFFKKLCFEKRENINVFWKGNETKGGNKDISKRVNDTKTGSRNFFETNTFFYK